MRLPEQVQAEVQAEGQKLDVWQGDRWQRLTWQCGGHLQGCKAIICMPVTTPEIKINAVRKMGGTVELVGESYSETQLHAQV